MEAIQAVVSSGSSLMLLLGFFLPPFIDVFNRFIKDSQARWWVANLIYLIVAAVILWVAEAFTGLNRMQVIEAVGIAFFAISRMGNLTYEKVWEKSEIRETLSLDATKLQ